MILIVGGHPAYQDKAPDCERWVMGKSFDRAADRAFEMHRRERWLSRASHLNDFPCPVVMQDRYPEVETSAPYPLTEVFCIFGRFQTCTISYMVALALFEGHDTAIWGVGGDTELYEYQVPDILFFAGYARARGLRVTAHPESKLHRILNPSARYGYDGTGELYR